MCARRLPGPTRGVFCSRSPQIARALRRPNRTTGHMAIATAPSELAAPSAGVNPWIVALSVTVPTFMEVLDTSIANVALRYISGGLAAAANDSEWVITSYLAANAVVLPISGWLSNHLGRRRYY